MVTCKNLTDAELVLLLKEGNHAAFAELYDRYAMMIYFKVNQMLRDEEQAKDLVQDVFMSLWLKAELIKAESNLQGYLYVSSRNKVLNLIRDGKTKNDFLSAIAAHTTEISTDMMDRLDERELMSFVAAEIAKLPAKMRLIFELSRIEDLSHREIALRLGISEQTVKSQVHNALVVLRAKLNGYAPGIMVILIWMQKK